MSGVLPRNRFAEHVQIPFAHGAGTDADVSVKVIPLPRRLRVESVRYLNVTGLAEHASNFATILAQYAFVIADDVADAVADTVNDKIKFTAHGLETGDGPIQIANSGGGLPTGLSASTDYWVIRVDADYIAFAADIHKAIAGTKINITGAGTGTQTISDTATTRRVFAYWSTDSDLPGADNSIPANTFLTMTLNRDPTLVIPAGTVLEFKADEDGTTNVPAGSGVIIGKYINR